MLAAAEAVISERGFAAPFEAIARRAGVSKQTVYNHYGGKAGLVRELIRRRVEELTAPLSEPRAGLTTEAALAAFARSMLEIIESPLNLALTRLAIQGASDLPDIAEAIHVAGHLVTRERLAAFLGAEARAGRLIVEDADEAAELFSGMVRASQLRGLLGLPLDTRPESVARRSAAIARRFVAAYAAA